MHGLHGRVASALSLAMVLVGACGDDTGSTGTSDTENGSESESGSASASATVTASASDTDDTSASATLTTTDTGDTSGTVTDTDATATADSSSSGSTDTGSTGSDDTSSSSSAGEASSSSSAGDEVAETGPVVCCEPPDPDDPICIEGSTCCDDGQWYCNEGDTSSTCPGDVGMPCEEPPPPRECCDPGDEPICIEGQTCCDDGQWYCNDDMGQSDCPGDVGMVCEEPPLDCCSPDAIPDCEDGTAPACCFGGWLCLGDDEVCIPGIPCDEPVPS